MANNINQIADSLISIRKVIEKFRLQREKTELYDSNRFNPFQFMQTDEMGLSKILAFLLDPKETHGQGDLFLNSFLKYIGKYNFLAFNNIKISVEKSTSKNRRHDIFIEGFLDNKLCWVVSIENKLRFASDQKNQLKDYRDDLERYPNIEYCLIYLPVFKNPPSETSILEREWSDLIRNKKARLISAKDLMNWLDSTFIIAPAVKQFCHDFKKFLNEELMGNTKRNNELVDYLLNGENDNILFSALDVIDSTMQLYEGLIEILVSQLQEKFLDNYLKLANYGVGCKTQGDIYSRYYRVFLCQNNENWGVGIEFQRTKLCGGIYGIRCNKKENETLYNLLQGIFDEVGIKSSFKSSEWWSMWKSLEGDLFNWNAEILRKIPSGELANQVFELWKPLLDMLTTNLDRIKELDTKKS